MSGDLTLKLTEPEKTVLDIVGAYNTAAGEGRPVPADVVWNRARLYFMAYALRQGMQSSLAKDRLNQLFQQTTPYQTAP